MKLIYKIVVVVVVMLLAVIYYFFRGDTDVPIQTPTPTSTMTPMLTPLPSNLSGFIGPTGLREPASCSVGGRIEFRAPDLYASHDVSFRYRNVDNDGRNVRWVVSPADNLAIGPNLFSGLPIPDGESFVTIRLPSVPKAKEYTLRAFVGYAELVKAKDGSLNVEVKEARCTGSILIQLQY